MRKRPARCNRRSKIVKGGGGVGARESTPGAVELITKRVLLQPKKKGAAAS